MTLSIRILGCGTSSGVPRIGNDWGACDPTDERNRRTRASVLIESATTRILVDTSPDMRSQLLAANIAEVDAVLWTHDHADHCHGIDDLRQIYHHRRKPLPGYAREPVIALLKRRFAYAFDGRDGYPATIAGMDLPEVLTIGDITVRWADMPHGNIYSTGFMFHNNGLSVGYATDFHDVTPEMIALFQGADIWVADALREKPHPTHAHLAMTLAAIREIAPGRAILTHMDQSMDYATLRDRLPPNVEPAYDGLVLASGMRG